jgi:hypothetical protein
MSARLPSQRSHVIPAAESRTTARSLSSPPWARGRNSGYSHQRALASRPSPFRQSVIHGLDRREHVGHEQQPVNENNQPSPVRINDEPGRKVQSRRGVRCRTCETECGQSVRNCVDGDRQFLPVIISSETHSGKRVLRNHEGTIDDRYRSAADIAVWPRYFSTIERENVSREDAIHHFKIPGCRDDNHIDRIIVKN